MTTYVRVIDGDGEEYLTTRKELSDEIVAMQDEGFDAEITIVKEADTIEKLCDGYHVVNGIASFSSGDIYDSLKDAKDFADDLNSYCDRKGINYKGRIVLYAFIATDKGLIYVAKMNEKGELELI